MSDFKPNEWEKRNWAGGRSRPLAQAEPLGNYLLHELPGEGGFGVVYRATSKFVARDVAIKLHFVRDDEVLTAFQMGCNYLSQLDHPYIITIYDFFVEDDSAAMVMELMDSAATLRQLVGEFGTPESLGSAVRIFGKVLSAMRYCHERQYKDLDGQVRRGVFHGDIKPDNIFVTPKGIKMSDFMIPNLEVRDALGRRNTFDRADTRLYGSPMYMCPEQMDGEVNSQTDIFNIGISVFELITGFYPYEGEEGLLAGVQVPARAFNPAVPDWLERIVSKCIEISPSRRYSRISDIQRDLARSQGAIGRGKGIAMDRPERTILLLAANPKGTPPLRLDEEDRKIDQGLERARKRDQFKLVQKWAVTDDDLRRAMLDNDPEIVHFSGHGSGADGLAFEDDGGQTQLISGDALGRLFELCSDSVKCVVLNACYSEAQADAISQHIDYVVGMKKAIGDEAAIKFAVGFYDALGAGRDVEKAFKFGCSAIDLKGIPEYLTPVLKKRSISATGSTASPSGAGTTGSRIDGSGKTGTPNSEPSSASSAKTIGPIRLFYFYSHQDEELRKELENHLSLLRRKGLIARWHDRMIGAGDEWKGEIDKNLEEAQVVLLVPGVGLLLGR